MLRKIQNMPLLRSRVKIHSMKLLSSRVLIVIIALLLAISSAGCSNNGDKLKDTVLQAIGKQKEITSYTFEGSAQLSLSPPAAANGTNLLAAGLLSLVKESTITWSGVAAADPLRLEAQLQVTPKGSDTSYPIRVLIKDNKLFFNIPLLNREDEFFVYDLQPSGQSGGSAAFNAELVQSLSVAKMTGALVETMNPKWFAEGKEPVKLSDGQSAKTVTATIKPKDLKDWQPNLAEKLPVLLGTILQSIGQTGGAKSDIAPNLESVTLDEPATVTLRIDDQGFVREQEVAVKYTQSSKDGHAGTTSMHMRNAINELNQNPKFTMEIPTKTVPFEEVLKLLKGKP